MNASFRSRVQQRWYLQASPDQDLYIIRSTPSWLHIEGTHPRDPHTKGTSWQQTETLDTNPMGTVSRFLLKMKQANFPIKLLYRQYMKYGQALYGQPHSIMSQRLIFERASGRSHVEVPLAGLQNPDYLALVQQRTTSDIL